jgi:hypothetical protein
MALPAGKQKSRLADALLAEGPDPDYADALMLFGRFVGEWDVDWTAYDGDGRQVANERGEWIFDWVLEGRAVQDVWIIPARGRRGRLSREGEYGTTIRFYDPQLDVWLVTWSGPINRARRTFVARASGWDIVQDGQNEEGHPLRWVFSDIEPRSFSWQSVCSHDGGKTWRLREEMHVYRGLD